MKKLYAKANSNTTELAASEYIRPTSAVIAIVLLGAFCLSNLVALFAGAQAYLNPFPFSPNMSLFSALVLTGICAALAAQIKGFYTVTNTIAWVTLAFIALTIPLCLTIKHLNLWPAHPELCLSASALCCLLILTNRTLSQNYITRYDMLMTVFTLIPILSVFSYVFDPVAMYKNYRQWVLPVPTAIGFLLCFLGLCGQTHSKGAAGLLTRNSHYARNFRLLFLLVLIIPLSIGSSLALAVDFGYMRAGFAAAIFCLMATLIIASVLANNAIVQENWLKKLLREEQKNQNLHNYISDVLELSSDAILLLNRELDVLHANQGAATLFGWRQEELQESGLGALVPNEHYPRFEKLIKRFFKSPKLSLRKRHPINVLVQNRLGEMMSASLNLSKRESKNAQHIVAVFRSTSEVASKIKDLKQQLQVDILTGAYSRAEFEHHCAKLARSQRKNEPKIAVILLDIDNFKAINDTYGHPTGDRVLQTLSQTAQECLRNDDRLFRIGGEEFAIIANQIDSDHAQLLAERIRTIIKAKPMIAGPKELFITCSIGVCLSYPAYINETIKKADVALYEAKRNGKDQVIVVS